MIPQKVTVLIGMPGSGKTHKGKYLAKRRGEWWTYLDNVFVGHRVLEFHALLRRGQNIIVSDIQFCNADTLNLFLAGIPGAIEVHCWYFANDPEQCKANARQRNRDSLDRELAAIDRYTLSYNPPKQYTIPVWHPGMTPVKL